MALEGAAGLISKEDGIAGMATQSTALNGEITEEITVVGEGRYSDPSCINASNTYHQCTEDCLQNTKTRRQIKEGKTVQNGERSQEVVGVRHVDPKCVNASNPYHHCTVNCSKKTPDTMRQNNGGSAGHSAHNGERSDEGSAAKERNANSMCVNASNPYHRCTEYCSQRSQGTRKPTWVGKSEESVGHRKLPENRDVDPRCVNVSNPYHKCTKYCVQKSHKMGQSGEGKTVANKGELKKSERTDVNPRCPNGTNPYHKCTESCTKRIHKTI